MGSICNYVHLHKTYRGEGNAKTEAETGGIWPQAKEAKEFLEPPEDGRWKEQIVPRVSRGYMAL